MIGKIIRKIKIFDIIMKLSKMDPNDYSFGYRIRKVLNLYKENKKIKEQEIFKEKSKP